MSRGDWHNWGEQLTTGLAWVDPELRLQWVNPALAEWLELGPRSIVGQSLGVLFADPAGWLARAARVVTEQRPTQWRWVALITLSGHEVTADIAVQSFEDGLLLELHPLLQTLATRSPLSATLRGFAHEVKNPLAGLRGAAQLLLRRVGNDDLQGLAQLIIDEADRLGTLANRLLHHDGAAQLSTVNIHQLLERLSDLLLAEATPPQLRHDYDPSVPDQLVDADRLQQLLLNLARNALEAGAHTLTMRTRIEHGLRLGEQVARTVLRVDVIDDGSGVPPALRETLFEPLVSGRVDGTGLGLALSREIAHEHAGELRCSSSRPGETVFSLYLPLERT